MPFEVKIKLHTGKRFTYFPVFLLSRKGFDLFSLLVASTTACSLGGMMLAVEGNMIPTGSPKKKELQSAQGDRISKRIGSLVQEEAQEQRNHRHTPVVDE